MAFLWLSLCHMGLALFIGDSASRGFWVSVASHSRGIGEKQSAAGGAGHAGSCADQTSIRGLSDTGWPQRGDPSQSGRPPELQAHTASGTGNNSELA